MRDARVRTRRQIRERDASVAHQRESLTGAGVEADRRDSLLFHFISFFLSFFFYVFCSNSGRMTRVSAAELTERKREEEGLLLGPDGDEGERDAAGRNRSMSRLHERTRTESTVRRRETGRKRARRKGNGVGRGEGRGNGRTHSSLGRMLSSGDKMHLLVASARRKYNANCVRRPGFTV